ncbi:MAG TPA: hypothetical protein VMQ61_05105 [Thermoanaerobaculia bacterium]|nr:hypothetical protein [Thermoanaerobaculia bacterium]
MATRYEAPLAGLENARFAASALEDRPTVEIPKWLMVLAARGEVTLRVAMDLEDDPLGDDERDIPTDDTATGY